MTTDKGRTISVLIVDDEPLSRDVLRTLIADLDDFALIGEARDGVEALAAIARHRPSLILLDVQMPELNGVHLVRALASIADYAPAIVFVTAHDEFAIPAFDAEAVDYLVKPFTDDRFRASIARVRKYFERERAVANRAAPVPVSMLVTIGARSIVLPTDSIEWVSADGYCSRLHTPKGSYLVRKSLAALEKEFGDTFVRVHRAALVRAGRVRVMVRSTTRGGQVVMESGAMIPVSERRRAELAQRLGQRL